MALCKATRVTQLHMYPRSRLAKNRARNAGLKRFVPQVIHQTVAKRAVAVAQSEPVHVVQRSTNLKFDLGTLGGWRLGKPASLPPQELAAAQQLLDAAQSAEPAPAVVADAPAVVADSVVADAPAVVADSVVADASAVVAIEPAVADSVVADAPAVVAIEPAVAADATPIA